MRSFEIAGMQVPPGRRKDLKIRVSELSTATPVFIPVTVLHGRRSGPVLFVTAAVHGDEINGVEIVRRVRAAVDPARLRGTLILVMIANPLGFMAMSRVLPDGRNLNRHFPGRSGGSMASQIAGALFRKVVRISGFGIDLHTATAGRANLPHVRADMRRRKVCRLARAFGREVIFDMRGEEGTLRRVATESGIPTIVYEAGEPLKFQEPAVLRGVEGVRNVLSELGMAGVPPEPPPLQVVVRDHRWIRAKKGGILNLRVKPGDIIETGDTIAVNTKPFGTEVNRLRAPRAGLVVGCTTVPMVYPGAAVCHVVSLDRRQRARWKRLGGGG